MRLVTRCVRRLTPRAAPRGALPAVASVVGFVHLQRRSLTVCLPVAFPACSPQVTMVKQKIHTARNQTVKAHRNGIKKPKRQRYRSTKGVRLCNVMPWRCCGCDRALVAYVSCCAAGARAQITAPHLPCPSRCLLPLLLLWSLQMDPRFVRNAKYAKKHNKKAPKATASA